MRHSKVKKGYYRRKPFKPYDQWWKEKQEKERLQRERREWETARDAEIQDLMCFKEQAEDACSDRIVQQNGEDILEMRDGENDLMAIWGFLADYEHVVSQLQRHIPSLEYDPRIVSGLVVQSKAAGKSRSDWAPS